MYPSSQEVKQILLSRGVTNLYHANTVVTSLSFIRTGGLLSREYAEKIGVPQTPQQSDARDKELRVYNDIFFDSVDIHERAKAVNDYGPVTFVYSLNVLDITGIDVKVTKSNPINWPVDMEEAERYFASEEELSTCFVRGNFGQHITFRNTAQLPLIPYLTAILLEDPKIENTKYFNDALSALNEELRRNGISIPVTVRSCPPNCHCHEQYASRQENYTFHRFKLEM